MLFFETKYPVLQGYMLQSDPDYKSDDLFLLHLIDWENVLISESSSLDSFNLAALLEPLAMIL